DADDGSGPRQSEGAAAGTRAARTHPHHHRHRAVHDPEDEDVESRVADERAGTVELDNESFGVPVGGPPQRVLHEVDLDRVVPSARPPDGEIRARTLTPDQALLDYLRTHGLKRISKRLVSSGAVDVVATAAPGIKDILVLGKVKSLERERKVDLIILDAPAA